MAVAARRTRAGATDRIARIDARTGESSVLAHSQGAHWDNHLLAL